ASSRLIDNGTGGFVFHIYAEGGDPQLVRGRRNHVHELCSQGPCPPGGHRNARALHLAFPPTGWANGPQITNLQGLVLCLLPEANLELLEELPRPLPI